METKEQKSNIDQPVVSGSLQPIPTDILEDLKQMSNNYIVCNQSYVIPKSVLDMYIEYLEGQRQ